MQPTQQQIDFCMECGICTGSCPVSRITAEFSPRQMLKRAMVEPQADPGLHRQFWSCLTCGRCSERCPADIDFPEFNRQYRIKARNRGVLPLESHHGIFQSISDLQTRPIRQQRTGWADQSGKFTTDRGEYFYFVGCLPFFDVTFRYLDISSTETARNVLKLLNKIGITPVISNDERCCGHDALWNGDEALFVKLARLNIEIISASGAKIVLFSCPEGYFTFKNHYPAYFGELPFDVMHVTELLAKKLPGMGNAFVSNDLTSQDLVSEDSMIMDISSISKELDNMDGPVFSGESCIVTYHDPCRLGRGAGIYDAPRQLLQNIPGTQLVEMERNRENSMCCGTSAWIECSGCSKQMQIERLYEAARTGASIIITACPKCRIHLACALKSSELAIRVVDIFSYLGSRSNLIPKSEH
ncbi:MAG: (Fe-S)-binding protein [Desulfamplus sp.]|nr:(Fe-S)-binding protein [Desulfamplus sp.]